MISYDSYKNRIEKVAKVKAFVIKFKFLIIGVLALLIAGITALLVTKGMVTTAMTLPAQVTYGDDYAPSQASAFLSSVRYEYTLKDKIEWTEEKPLKAGKYLARTVTNKAIGRGYGDPVEFEIVKKQAELTIVSEKMTYGNDPACALDGIVAKYGDRIVSVGSLYDLPKVGGSMEIEVTVSKLIIFDKYGNDSSDCYDYKPVTKNVTLEKKIVTVQPLNINETYSGNPVSTDRVELYAQISSKDTISAKTVTFTRGGVTVPAPEYAGTYDINVSNVTITNNGVNVNHLYTLNYNSATLNIRRKDITITTGSASKVYDGTPLKNEAVTPEGLISGHTVSANSAFTEITNVYDSYPQNNVNDFTISDKNGNDVTQNYSLTPIYGTLTVSKREITITTASASKVYDGKPLSDGTPIYNEKQLADNQTLEIKSTYSITNVWDTNTENNRNTYYIDFNGNDVTENYKITYNYGTLTVTKHSVTITTEDYKDVYDGIAHYSPDFDAEGLVAGHEAQPYNKTSVTNVADSKKDDTKFIIMGGSSWYAENVTDNYAINYIYGTLTVTPRPITVVINAAKKVYDGKPLSNDWDYSTHYFESDKDGLLNGDTLTPVASKVNSITDVDTKVNTVEFTANGNYDIKGYDRTDGTLTVTKRYLELTSKSKTWVYDGDEHFEEGYDITGGSCADGQDIKVTSHTAVKEYTPAYVANNLNYAIIYNGKEVTKNYDLNIINDGTLEIEQRAIKVVTADDSRVYNGKALSNGGYTTNYYYDVSLAGLIGNDKLTVVGDLPEITNVGIKPNDIVFKVPNDNYYVAGYAYGTLEITKRPITITTGSKTKEYDGTELFCDELIYNKADLAEGQEIVVDGSNSIENAYDTEEGNNIVFYDIKIKETGEVVTGNYDITDVYGTLTITSRPLKVITDGDIWVYDGEHHRKGSYTVIYYGTKDSQTEENAFVKAGDSLHLYGDLPEITDFGTKPNAIPLEVYNSNYEIVATEYGTLKITKREITVQLNSYSVDYGDTNYAYQSGNEAVTSTNKVVEGEQLNIYNAYPDCPERPSVDTYDIVCKQAENQILKSDGTDSTNNYEITFDKGTLTVNKKQTTVQLDNYQFYYGDDENYENTYAQLYLEKLGTVTLCYGEELKLSVGFMKDGKRVDAPKNVGTYGIVIDKEEILYTDGTLSANGNYEIGYLNSSSASIFILRRDIQPVPISVSAEYGEPFAYPSGVDNYTYSDYKRPAYGEKIEIFVEYDIGDEDVPNVGKYNAIPAGFKVYSDGSVEEAELYQTSEYYRDVVYVTDNYVFWCSFNDFKDKLEIAPRSITVQLKDIEVDYGDDIFEKADGSYKEITVGSLVIGDNLTVHVNFSFKSINADAGTYNIYALHPRDTSITRDDGKDATKNYNVTYQNATLTVKPREIIVGVEPILEGVKYGDEITHTPLIGGDGLAYDDTIVLDVTYWQNGQKVEAKNAGIYSVEVANCKFLYADGTMQKVENYNVTVYPLPTTLIIDRRQITVTLKDVTKEYGEVNGSGLIWSKLNENDDGVPNYLSGSIDNYILITGDGLAEGDYVELYCLESVDYVEMRNAGTYDIRCYWLRINNSDGEAGQYLINQDRGGNYNFTIANTAKLTINPKFVKVELENIDVTYGEFENALKDYSFEVKIPEAGESISFENFVLEEGISDYRLNAGEYYFKQASTVTVYNSDGEVIEKGLGNYKLNVVEGKLTVKQREITIVLKTLENVTYGTPLEYMDGKNNFTLYGGGFAYNEELEVVVAFYTNSYCINSVDPKNAGTYYYQISLSKSTLFAEDGSIGNIDNYAIICATRSVNIKKKIIKIDLPNEEIIYGDAILGNPYYNAEEAKKLGIEYGESLTIYIEYPDMKYIGGTAEVGNYTSKVLLYTAYDVNNRTTPDNYTITGEGSLKILQKDLSVYTTDNFGDFVYGDTIEYDPENVNCVGRAYYGEKAVATDIKYFDEDGNLVEDINSAPAGTYTVKIVEVEITLKGEIKTQNYNITYGNGTQFKILVRNVEVKVDETPFVYDGEPHSHTEIIAAYFVDENGVRLRDLTSEEIAELTPTNATEETDAGTYENTVKFVGENYSVYTWPCNLVISERTVDVITNTKSFVYDGKEHNFEKADIYSSYGFPAIVDEYTVNWTAAPVKNVADAFSENNTCKIVFTDTAKANNYVINYVYGTIYVTPRPIKIETGSDKKEYDGKPLSNGDIIYNEADLAEGQTLAVSEAPSITDVWETQKGNNVRTVQIALVKNGEVTETYVTENYAISYEYGTLTITARPLKVTTASDSKPYDGTPLSNGGFTVIYYGDNAEQTEENAFCKAGERLQRGNNPSITDYGTRDNDIWFILPNDNYKIVNTDYGTLEITKTDLFIAIKDINAIYGDNTLKGIGEYDEDKTHGLVNGEELTVAVKYRTDDGEPLNEVKNVGTYFITLDLANCFVHTGRYIDGEEINGLNNYNITYNDEEAKLTVSPKEILVELFSYRDEIYGNKFAGYPDAYNNFTYADRLLAYGEQLKVTVEYSDADGNTVTVNEFTNAGTYTIIVTGITVINADGTDGIAENYIIETKTGELVIKPRPLTIVRLDVNGEYDGTEWEAREYDTYSVINNYKKDGLVNGDTLEIVEKTVTKLLNAGTKNIETEFIASDNYTVTYRAGSKITVAPREITLVTGDVRDEEYGYALSYLNGDDYEVIGGSFVYNEALGEYEKLEIAISFYYDEACTVSVLNPVDVGTYYYKLNVAACTVTGSVDPALVNGIGNYHLTAVPEVKFAQITARRITISLNSPSDFTYNGKTYAYSEGYKLISGAFANGEGIDAVGVTYYECLEDGTEVKLYGLPKNAGLYHIVFDKYTTVINGRNSTDNYDVTCEEGVYLEIFKKDIRIIIGDASKTYDGNAYLIDNDNKISFEADVVAGEAVARTVKYYLNGEEVLSPVNAGVYDIVFDRPEFRVVGGLASNYNIISTEEQESAKLTISKRTVGRVEVVTQPIEIPQTPADVYKGITYASSNSNIIATDRAKLTPFYTFYQDGVKIPVEDVKYKGDYEVRLSFTVTDDGMTAEIEANREVLKNYELPDEFLPGILTITARQVTVQAVYTGEELTYNGAAVDLDDGYWKDLFGFIHWHTTDAAEAGFAEGYAETLTPVYTFTLRNQVVDKPVHAATYVLTVSFENVSEDDYFVTCNPIDFIIKPKVLTVDLSSFDEETVYSDVLITEKYPEEDILALANIYGFIAGDEDSYNFGVNFYDTDGYWTSVEKAGEISVKINFVYTVLSWSDYTIDDENSDWGRLVIKPYTIYVRANSKSELYNGQTISLGEYDYKIIGGENGENTTLLPGHDMKIAVSGSLTPDVPSRPINITSYKITAYGIDVTANYNVVTKYASYMGDNYNAGSFMTTLSYIPRTVYYEQIVLDNREFDYTGSFIDLNIPDGAELFKIVDGGDGFLDGHRGEVQMIIPRQYPGTYTDLIVMKAVDSSGKNASVFYRFKLTNAEASKIVVKAVEVKVELKIDDATLQSAWAQWETFGTTDGSVLKTDGNYKEDWVVLNSALYEATGLWDGHECEIVVVKTDAGFTLNVITYKQSANVRLDNSNIYSVSAVKPANLSATVQLVNINSLNT